MDAKGMLLELLRAKGKAQYLEEAWKVVTEAAFDMRPRLVLSHRFSPEAIEEVMPIVEAYEQELEASMRLDERIEQELCQRQVVLDEDTLGEVDAYLIIYADRIEFIANENGYGERLPKKQRKYIGSQGDRRWQFPLSMLNEVLPFAEFAINEDGTLHPKN